MSYYTQQLEKKISKLQMQVREIEAVREENTMLIESLKNSQQRVAELESEEVWHDETGPI